MYKTAISDCIVIGFLAIISATTVFAQELEEGQAPEKYDFIIEEALDKIEKSIDPVIAGEELSIEPKISETLEVQINKDAPVELKLLEDAVEIKETNIDADLTEDPGILERPLETSETEPDAIISVEAGNIDEIIQTTETEFKMIDQNDEIQLDEPEETFKVKIIPLLHAEASSLIEALDRMKSPQGEVSYNEEDRTLVLKDTSERLEEMSTFVKDIDVLLETGIFALEYVEARDIVANIEEILTKDVGQAEFDEESNSVVVTDTPVKIGKIKELIQKLDRFNVEVLIAARTLKIVLNDEHPIGVDWEAIVSKYQKLALSGEEDGNIEQLSLGTVSQEDYDILLEALDTVGVVRTVSEENIRTENETTIMINSPASLRQGEEIQFHLTLMIEKDEPLEVAIRTKETDQENVMIQMENGETIVIGGLFEDVMVASSWKIPLLGDLPLLGFVFRNEGEELRTAEIITFLTVQTAKKKI